MEVFLGHRALEKVLSTSVAVGRPLSNLQVERTFAPTHFPSQDTPAQARSSNMGADLGQVEYVFSDKTGTLTQNLMKFKRCSVAGTIYGEIDQASKDLMTPQQLEVPFSLVSKPLRSASVVLLITNTVQYTYWYPRLLKWCWVLCR